MKEQGPFLTWLADPVRVLAGLNCVAIAGCLLAGLALDGCAGFVFGMVGTVLLVELRRALQ